jgi:hypothetical protein
MLDTVCSSSSDSLQSTATTAPTDIVQHVALDAPKERTSAKASILSGFKLQARDEVAVLSPTHQIIPNGSLPVHPTVTLQLSHPRQRTKRFWSPTRGQPVTDSSPESARPIS